MSIHQTRPSASRSIGSSFSQYPQTPRDDGSWYKIDTNLWTITEEQSAFDPHLQIARTQKEQWNDEKFEAACAAYAKKQEGAKK